MAGKLARHAATAALIVWFLGWLALYLEIFRWHHVVLTHIAGVVWPDPQVSAKPGGFVRTVVVSAVVMPPIAVALFLWTGQSILTALSTSAIVCGIILLLFGAINLIAQHQAVAVDVTLRLGSTGFVLLGAVLVATGLLLRLQRPGRA